MKIELVNLLQSHISEAITSLLNNVVLLCREVFLMESNSFMIHD